MRRAGPVLAVRWRAGASTGDARACGRRDWKRKYVIVEPMLRSAIRKYVIVEPMLRGAIWKHVILNTFRLRLCTSRIHRVQNNVFAEGISKQTLHYHVFLSNLQDKTLQNHAFANSAEQGGAQSRIF